MMQHLFKSVKTVWSLCYCTVKSSTHLCPVPTGEDIQKKSNKIQHLYRQMCHLEKELTLLDPSCFSKPESVSRALQRVQSMKSFLEDHLSITSHANQNELKYLLKKKWPHFLYLIRVSSFDSMLSTFIYVWVDWAKSWWFGKLITSKCDKVPL